MLRTQDDSHDALSQNGYGFICPRAETYLVLVYLLLVLLRRDMRRIYIYTFFERYCAGVLRQRFDYNL